MCPRKMVFFKITSHLPLKYLQIWRVTLSEAVAAISPSWFNAIHAISPWWAVIVTGDEEIPGWTDDKSFRKQENLDIQINYTSMVLFTHTQATQIGYFLHTYKLALR